MPTSNDLILDESLEQLRDHFHPEWGDRTLLDVFKRLLAKNIKAPRWKEGDHVNIQRHQIRSHRERLTTDELAQLERGHDRDEPESEAGPIIVAVCQGRKRLLDGNTRINLWVREKNTELHGVNVHVIEGSASSYQLPLLYS